MRHNNHLSKMLGGRTGPTGYLAGSLSKTAAGAADKAQVDTLLSISSTVRDGLKAIPWKCKEWSSFAYRLSSVTLCWAPGTNHPLQNCNGQHI